jgi:lactoylglutathione lyase
MKLNHINLVVQDVGSTHMFLEKYFGLQPIRPATPKMALLSDDNGMIINVFKGETANYPEAFHIGFMQENKEQVGEIYQRLKNDGFNPEPPKTFHGSWTFYFECPGKFVIEIFCMLTAGSSAQPNPSLGAESLTARNSAA